jgi:hypothetical protein
MIKDKLLKDLLTMYSFHFFIMFIYTIKIIKWQQLKTMFLIK